MSEREEVLTYFGWQTCVMGDECCHDECRIPVQMADEIVSLRQRVRELEAEEQTADHIINAHGKLLTEIANAIKGEPEPLSMHSHHDLPELVNALVKFKDAMERRAAWEYHQSLIDWAERAERERDEARRERDALQKFVALQDAWETEAMGDITMLFKERNEYRHRAERAERVVEAARSWLADLWRGDLNGTVIGVCMEYEPDGQYVLWEQVAPIAEAVRALDAAEVTP